MKQGSNFTIEMSQLIRDAKANFLMKTEMFSVIAAEQKAKYDAYVSAGFTNDQAMALLIGDKL